MHTSVSVHVCVSVPFCLFLRMPIRMHLSISAWARPCWRMSLHLCICGPGSTCFCWPRTAPLCSLCALSRASVPACVSCTCVRLSMDMCQWVAVPICWCTSGCARLPARYSFRMQAQLHQGEQCQVFTLVFPVWLEPPDTHVPLLGVKGALFPCPQTRPGLGASGGPAYPWELIYLSFLFFLTSFPFFHSSSLPFFSPFFPSLLATYLKRLGRGLLWA
ncbi:hypothetical protein HJG60_010977 [Phyllostomus discolor]|uniref:Uncharacterized protein n=1 Tax=Phyllostomus discolor TaxID=89673 RepID=A0A834EAD8_9CHIR|nr:hypothetical protein HJG60_010977 [Phyllostomus discolor]